MTPRARKQNDFIYNKGNKVITTFAVVYRFFCPYYLKSFTWCYAGYAKLFILNTLHCIHISHIIIIIFLFALSDRSNQYITRSSSMRTNSNAKLHHSSQIWPMDLVFQSVFSGWKVQLGIVGSHGFWKLPLAHDTLVNEKRSPFPHTVINQAYILTFSEILMQRWTLEIHNGILLNSDSFLALVIHSPIALAMFIESCSKWDICHTLFVSACTSGEVKN